MDKAAEIFLVKSPFDLRGGDQGHRAELAVEEEHEKVLNVKSYTQLRSHQGLQPSSGWGDLGKASKSLGSSAFPSQGDKEGKASSPSCHRDQDRSSC